MYEINLAEGIKLLRKDKYNVELHIYRYPETGTGEVVKERGKSWFLEGYYPSVAAALRAVITRDLVTDGRTITSLEDYVNNMERQMNMFVAAMEQYDVEEGKEVVIKL